MRKIFLMMIIFSSVAFCQLSITDYFNKIVVKDTLKFSNASGDSADAVFVRGAKDVIKTPDTVSAGAYKVGDHRFTGSDLYYTARDSNEVLKYTGSSFNPAFIYPANLKDDVSDTCKFIGVSSGKFASRYIYYSQIKGDPPGGSSGGWTLGATKIYNSTAGTKVHIRTNAGDTTGTYLLNVYGTFNATTIYQGGSALGTGAFATIANYAALGGANTFTQLNKFQYGITELGAQASAEGQLKIWNGATNYYTLIRPAENTSDKTQSLQDLTGTIAMLENDLGDFAATTSAQLFGIISDETGSGGYLVRSTSPTLTTPTLGVASATSINKMVITSPATACTLTVADGKTFTSSNTLTLQGTDGSTLNIGTGGTLGTAAYTASTAYQAADADLSDLADGNLTYSKVGGLTASRVVVSDAGGLLSASTVTSTTLNYLDISSSLTTLLAGKQNTLTTGNLTENVTGLEFDNTRTVIGGAATLSLTSGYGIPTTTQMSNWNTAYGWGNPAGVYAPLSGGCNFINGTVIFGEASDNTGILKFYNLNHAYYATLQTTTLTGNVDINLPPSSGTIALTTAAWAITAITHLQDSLNAMAHKSGTTFSGLVKLEYGITNFGKASTSDGVLDIYNSATAYHTTLYTSENAANRDILFPDVSGTVALTANKISDFAAVTSAELAGKVSNETGTGYVVFSSSPTLVAPTLGSALATKLSIGTSSQIKILDVNGSSRFTGSGRAVLTGTIDPAASTSVVGVNTLFTYELVPGDQILVTGETRTVATITDDTHLTVTSAFSNNANDTSPERYSALMIIRDSSATANTNRFIIDYDGDITHSGASFYSSGYGDFASLKIGSTEVINSSRVVDNVTFADGYLPSAFGAKGGSGLFAVDDGGFVLQEIQQRNLTINSVTVPVLTGEAE